MNYNSLKTHFGNAVSRTDSVRQLVVHLKELVDAVKALDERVTKLEKTKRIPKGESEDFSD